MNEKAAAGLVASGQQSSLTAWSRELDVEQHRRLAVEFATKLPKEPARAKAILEDAIRFHSVFNDIEASAVSRDFLGKSG